MRVMQVICAAVAVLLLFVSSVSAKVSPPEELKTVFLNLLRLEDLLEEKEWEAVMSMLGEFAEGLSSASQSIREDLGKDLWCDPSERFGRLESAVRKRDFDGAYKAQIDFQICLYGIMDSYAYKFHPSLLALNKYLDEAIEACEARKADVVKKEMEEIESTYLKARPYLQQGNISEAVISGFDEKIQSVKASLGRLEYEASHKTFWEMKKALDSILQTLNM